ncbi:MAG: hypothetical protein Q8N05_19755 [Bacteroidota bacterium]|nr:hypothetical protein [Bacteroidota bacterium]
MLKDNQPTYYPPQPTDLSVESKHEVELILGFIDDNISAFCDYYQNNQDSNKENWISNLLVRHFQICNIEQGGFLPFDFSKNPPQSQSGKETDIGVYALTRNTKPITIIEFEAKRFSETSKFKEYVSGERGGIERFKRGEHASHLWICGMFAYVQSRTSNEWIQKVNEWISELAKKNNNPEIDWTSPDEKLSLISYLSPKVELQKSVNKRKKPLDSITIYHYFINLN